MTEQDIQFIQDLFDKHGLTNEFISALRSEGVGCEDERLAGFMASNVLKDDEREKLLDMAYAEDGLSDTPIAPPEPPVPPADKQVDVAKGADSKPKPTTKKPNIADAAVAEWLEEVDSLRDDVASGETSLEEALGMMPTPNWSELTTQAQAIRALAGVDYE